MGGELPVLHVERLVEPEQVAVALEFRSAGVLGQEEEDGIAEHVEDEEGEQRDADDADDELHQQTDDVASHGSGAPGGSGAAISSSASTNIRSISSRGASYSTRLEMPQTPRRPHLNR